MRKKQWIIGGVLLVLIIAIAIILLNHNPILASPKNYNYTGVANVILIDPNVTPNLTQVVLTDLDGSGYLNGRYVVIEQVGTKACGKGVPTPRVFNKNLNFTFVPVKFSTNITPNGTPGYFGCDDLSDSGHRFDQVLDYYYVTQAAKYFKDKFGIELGIAITVKEYAVKFGKTGSNNYIDTIVNDWPDPNLYLDGKPDARGLFHEYTHMIQYKVAGKVLTYGKTWEDSAEAWPKYFEMAYTNTTVDTYMFNPAHGPILFSNYSAFQYNRLTGKDISGNTLNTIGFIVPSTWLQLRQTIGENTTDSIVFQTMKTIKFNKCAANSFLEATLKADKILYNGVHNSTIIDVFASHNIQQGVCL